MCGNDKKLKIKVKYGLKIDSSEMSERGGKGSGKGRNKVVEDRIDENEIEERQRKRLLSSRNSYSNNGSLLNNPVGVSVKNAISSRYVTVTYCVLLCILLCCNVLYCCVLHFITRYCIVYCTVLYCTIYLHLPPYNLYLIFFYLI